MHYEIFVLNGNERFMHTEFSPPASCVNCQTNLPYPNKSTSFDHHCTLDYCGPYANLT